MAEFGCPATLSTPLGSINFNDFAGAGANGTLWLVQSIDGLDGEPLRTPMDDKAGEDGAWLYNFLSSARHITVSGIMIPAVVVASVRQTAWQQAVERNQMEQSLRTKGRSIKAADGTWSWTPSGMGTYSLTVRCDVLPTFPGDRIKEFVFGLVAGDPNYD